MNLKYIFFFIIPVVLIGGYGKYRCEHKTFKDPLEKQFIWGLDGWSISHFLLFTIVGYCYPKTFFISMSIGIGWELFEHYYGTERPGWLGGYGDCDDLATDKETGNWWYGKWTDVVCNASGFIAGALVATTVKHTTRRR